MLAHICPPLQGRLPALLCCLPSAQAGLPDYFEDGDYEDSGAEEGDAEEGAAKAKAVPREFIGEYSVFC